MATRKLTFTLPETLAVQFANKIPPRHRSQYVAEALREKLAQRDRELIRACEIANRDPEVRAIEEEFDAISSDITEAWQSARQRKPAPPKRRGVVGPPRRHTRIGNQQNAPVSGAGHKPRK